MVLFPGLKRNGQKYSQSSDYYPLRPVLLALYQTNFLFHSGNPAEFELKCNIKVK